MLLKFSTFILAAWIGSTPVALACGVDTSSYSKRSAEKAKNGQHSPKGFGLTSADHAKDDRWEKVKERLKKAREAKSASKD
ncbi:MAG: hypothetical protein R3B45_01570 [Bdellovibrionota bacterium]